MTKRKPPNFEALAKKAKAAIADLQLAIRYETDRNGLDNPAGDALFVADLCCTRAKHEMDFAVGYVMKAEARRKNR